MSKLFGKITCIFLLLSPILQTYAGIGGFDMASTIGIVLSVIMIGRNGLSLSPIPVRLRYYFIFWLLSVVLMSFMGGLYPLLGVVRIGLLLLLVFTYCKVPFIIKSYRIIVYICMAFFMLQVLSSRYAGINIVGIASFLPISNEFSEIDLIDVSLNRSRFSSFFSEPAHFVQYLLPFIAIELFDDEKKRTRINKVETTLFL